MKTLDHQRESRKRIKKTREHLSKSGKKTQDHQKESGIKNQDLLRESERRFTTTRYREKTHEHQVMKKVMS